jgi:hypothetical protein
VADTLFDAEHLREPPPIPAPAVPRGERQRARFRGAIAVGMHPLSLTVSPYLRLHPDAQREIGGTGPRCGGCRFRVSVGGHARSFPKCMWPEPDLRRRVNRDRFTHGPATDCRASWPACTDYQPAVTG